MTMTRSILIIVIRLILPTLIVTCATFFLLRLVPGTPEDIQRGLRAAPTASNSTTAAPPPATALSSPVSEYGQWLADAVRLRFGTSRYTGAPAAQYVLPYFFRTALLAFAAFILAVGYAVLLVALAARYRRAAALITGGAHFLVALPEFWLAMLLLLIFAIKLPVLPLFGTGSPAHYALPLVALALNRGAVLVELLHGALRDAQARLYTTSAYIRGIGFWYIFRRYLLQNSLFVIIPLLTVQFGYLFGGAVIIEQVFSLPGFGNVLLQSLRRRDYAIAQFSVLLIAAVFSIFSLLGEWLHHTLNPQTVQRRLYSRITGG